MPMNSQDLSALGVYGRYSSLMLSEKTGHSIQDQALTFMLPTGLIVAAI